MSYSLTVHGAGYCTLLGQLTEIGDITKEKFNKRFREMQAAKDTYYVVVIEDTKIQKIIGAATLFVEKKMLRGASLVCSLNLLDSSCSLYFKCGHIEDVVVDSTYRGKQLGKRWVDVLHFILIKTQSDSTFGAYWTISWMLQDHFGLF